MRSTLYLKFLIIYVIFGFLSIFTVATLCKEIITSQLINEETSNLSQTTNVLGSTYFSSFFLEDTLEFDTESSTEAKQLLNSISTSLGASVWLVESDGTVILSTHLSGTSSTPSFIEDFNPAESGSSQYLLGYYHGYLNEECFTVIAPITKGFYTTGYILVHLPYSVISVELSAAMLTVYITVTLVFVLSFLILLGFHFLIYLPLRKVTEAATQYASGNLSYEIPVYTHDEMGYLSASLNYMSSQLKDMEDYQKKFIGNVSHDFRSPLTSIKGYINALADGTIPVELQEKYFNIILFETERLTDLTKDLLALNEFDTKELLLNKESFDIHEMIKNVATSFEGVCTTKRISIELLFTAKSMSVVGDKRKIQQVLYNLIDNAIKFSTMDSSVTVETSEVNDKAFISVKDYGMGIPKENLNKIWDRFYKSDLSRGKDKKGTGLGLAIVKEIVQAHNEHINVISTEGVGTEFLFSLPRPRNTL